MLRGLANRAATGQDDVFDLVLEGRNNIPPLNTATLTLVSTWTTEWDSWPTAEKWIQDTLQKGRAKLDSINNPTDMYALTAPQKVALMYCSLAGTSTGTKDPLSQVNWNIDDTNWGLFYPKITIINQLAAALNVRSYAAQDLPTKMRLTSALHKVAITSIKRKFADQNWTAINGKLRRLLSGQTYAQRNRKAQSGLQRDNQKPNKETALQLLKGYLSKRPSYLKFIKLGLYLVSVTRSVERNGQTYNGKKLKTFGDLISDEEPEEVRVIKTDNKLRLQFLDMEGNEVNFTGHSKSEHLIALAAKGILLYDSDHISVKVVSLKTTIATTPGSSRTTLILNDEEFNKAVKTLTEREVLQLFDDIADPAVPEVPAPENPPQTVPAATASSTAIPQTDNL
jgi:hypothetical protein